MQNFYLYFIENDCQPVLLDDGFIEINHGKSNFLKVIQLISSKDKLTCRKVKAVLRYHEPSAHKSMDQYAHHLLFTFYPFSGTYFGKLQKLGLMEIVDRYKSLLEPYGEMVNKALSNLRFN